MANDWWSQVAGGSSLINCPKCGPTNVRNIWDNGSAFRFVCVTCGWKGTTKFQPMRFEFDPPKLILPSETKEPVSE